jgi:hypothetical protein
MDRVIVERAVKALAAIGAAQQAAPERTPSAARERDVPEVNSEPVRESLALCGSPDCGGCYDVGDGRKIHPPKCGAGWVQ